MSPKWAKYPASGQRSSKRVPMEDLGTNRQFSPCIHVVKDDLVGPGVVCYKLSSNKTGVLGLGSPYNQQSRGRWYTWVWISPSPRTLQRVTTLPVPESAASDNDEVGESSTLSVFWVSFWYICLMYRYLVFSGFYFKPTWSSSIILIDPVSQ